MKVYKNVDAAHWKSVAILKGTTRNADKYIQRNPPFKRGPLRSKRERFEKKGKNAGIEQIRYT